MAARGLRVLQAMLARDESRPARPTKRLRPSTVSTAAAFRTPAAAIAGERISAAAVVSTLTPPVSPTAVIDQLLRDIGAWDLPLMTPSTSSSDTSTADPDTNHFDNFNTLWDMNFEPFDMTAYDQPVSRDLQH